MVKLDTTNTRQPIIVHKLNRKPAACTAELSLCNHTHKFSARPSCTHTESVPSKKTCSGVSQCGIWINDAQLLSVRSRNPSSALSPKAKYNEGIPFLPFVVVSLGTGSIWELQSFHWNISVWLLSLKCAELKTRFFFNQFFWKSETHWIGQHIWKCKDRLTPEHSTRLKTSNKPFYWLAGLLFTYQINCIWNNYISYQYS